MYVNLHAKVEIGSYKFEQINSVEIDESVIELSDKATVVLPKNIKSFKQKALLDCIKVGDKAKIYLGYNDKIHQEFEGYVREIESDAPLKIHLDDEMYIFKQNNFVESWEKLSLSELLKTIAPNHKHQCPDLSFSKFIIDNQSSYQVFLYLKKQYGLYTYLKDNILYCGFAYDIKNSSGATHKYEFKRNIKDNKLKFKRKEDYKIKIIAIANKANGTKIKEEIGSTDSNAMVRTLNFGDVSNSELKQYAKAKLKQLCFDGYSGSITGFGIPRTKAGDILNIIDNDEPERAGNYLIESVKIRWGETYFERINKASYKV
jgi:hypothetical protein